MGELCSCGSPSCGEQSGLVAPANLTSLAASSVQGAEACLQQCADRADCTAVQVDRRHYPVVACELYGDANASAAGNWTAAGNHSDARKSNRLWNFRSPRSCLAASCCYTRSAPSGPMSADELHAAVRHARGFKNGLTLALIITWVILGTILCTIMYCAHIEQYAVHHTSAMILLARNTTSAERKRRVARLPVSTYRSRRRRQSTAQPASSTPLDPGQTVAGQGDAAGGTAIPGEAAKAGARRDDAHGDEAAASIGAPDGAPQPACFCSAAARPEGGAHSPASTAAGEPGVTSSKDCAASIESQAPTSAGPVVVACPAAMSPVQAVSIPVAVTVSGEAKEATGGEGEEEGEEGEEAECALCLTEYIEGEEVRHLPCDHAFHPRCIDPWLVGGPSRTCPLCKADPFAPPAAMPVAAVGVVLPPRVLLTGRI